MDRVKRNHLLLMSDWTQLADSPLTVEQKEQWRLYRQQLRDLPDNGWAWPVPPAMSNEIPMTKL